MFAEWLRWDGESERPLWDEARGGVELYDHLGDDGSNFDAFENTNLAPNVAYANVTGQMAKLLRRSYNF